MRLTRQQHLETAETIITSTDRVRELNAQAAGLVSGRSKVGTSEILEASLANNLKVAELHIRIATEMRHGEVPS